MISDVLRKPNKAPETSSKKPIKVKSIIFLIDFVNQLIIKKLNIKVEKIDTKPIIRLFDSGKNCTNMLEKKFEKFKEIIMLTKNENKETKLTIKPFLYPL